MSTDDSTSLADEMRQNAKENREPTDYDRYAAVLRESFGLTDDEAQQAARYAVGYDRLASKGWRTEDMERKLSAEYGVEYGDLRDAVETVRVADVKPEDLADREEGGDNAPTEADLSGEELQWVERIRKQVEAADADPDDLGLVIKSRWEETKEELADLRQDLREEAAEATGVSPDDLKGLEASTLRKMSQSSESTDDPEPDPKSGDPYASDGESDPVREYLADKDSALARACLRAHEADDE